MGGAGERPIRASCETPVVTYDVHIRTTDGGIQYPDALGVEVQNGILIVQVGEDLEHSDTVYISPNYWCQYSVDPHSEDPLDLDLDMEEFEDEDFEDDEFEDEDLEDPEDEHSGESEDE